MRNGGSGHEKLRGLSTYELATKDKRSLTSKRRMEIMKNLFELLLLAGGFAILFFTDHEPSYGMGILCLSALVFVLRFGIEKACE
jgi:hypothetical protein